MPLGSRPDGDQEAPRVQKLWQLARRNLHERPALALGVLREIVRLAPSDEHARQLYREVSSELRGTDAEMRNGDRGRSKEPVWLAPVQSFVSCALWSRARQVLREAVVSNPGDSRIIEWLAYVRAESEAARLRERLREQLPVSLASGTGVPWLRDVTRATRRRG